MPVTDPAAPTRSVASRAIRPVPHATSRTRSPGLQVGDLKQQLRDGCGDGRHEVASVLAAAEPVKC